VTRKELSKTPTDHGRRPPRPKDGCLRRIPATGCQVNVPGVVGIDQKIDRCQHRALAETVAIPLPATLLGIDPLLTSPHDPRFVPERVLSPILP
jgi:hypothetical protein